MYETTKKELIDKVCEQLNAKGLKTKNAYGEVIPFSYDDGELSGFKFLPMENLVKMSECSIENLDDYKAIYHTWGENGVLNFKPYVVTDYDGYPSLIMRHNRFLRLSLGHNFAVFDDFDDGASCGSCSYEMDYLIQCDRRERVFNKGLITYLLWWAALIDVGFRFNNFVKLFNQDKEVIEQFLHENMKYWNHLMNYTWADVEKLITVENGNIDTTHRKVYQVSTKDEVVAYLAIGEKTVQVETSNNRLLTINIPDFFVGTNYNLDKVSDLEYYNAEVYAMKRYHYLEIIAVMALKLAGVHISFTGVYTIDKTVTKMKPINAFNVANLNAIYNAVPDEF